MKGPWVCGSCRSINRPESGRCYSCGQGRAADQELPAETTASGQDRTRGLLGAMTTVCPACGTHRVGWSSDCRSCGLSFDQLALDEVTAAASRGPGPLGRLFLSRLPVLIPGMLLLVIALVVFIIVGAPDLSRR